MISKLQLNVINKIVACEKGSVTVCWHQKLHSIYSLATSKHYIAYLEDSNKSQRLCNVS